MCLMLVCKVFGKVAAMSEWWAARFSAAAVCISSYKAGSFLFVGDCSKNLHPLDDIYYYAQKPSLMEGCYTVFYFKKATPIFKRMRCWMPMPNVILEQKT